MITSPDVDVDLESLLDADVPCGGNVFSGPCPHDNRAVVFARTACCAGDPRRYKCIPCYTRWLEQVSGRGTSFRCVVCGTRNLPPPVYEAF